MSAASPTIDQIVLYSAAHGNKYFKTQTQLFEYIKAENAKIIERHRRLHQPLQRSNFLQAGGFGTNSSLQSGSFDVASFLASSSSSSAATAASSSSSSSSAVLLNPRRSFFGAPQNSSASSTSNSSSSSSFSSVHSNATAEDQKPIEEKLLRPFCVHIDASVAPSSKTFQQQLQHQQQQNQSRFFSFTSSGNRSEQGLLAMFNEAGTTQRENLLCAGNRRQRTSSGEQQTAAATTATTAAAAASNGDHDHDHQVQTRFFIALTRENFAKVARGDVIPQLPQEHQHFFEIIEESAPCVLYFDVEMEPHTSLSAQERENLIQQVEAIEKNLAQASSTSLKNDLPVSLRRKLHCCPVGCNIVFDERTTRDVLIGELKRFLTSEFPLPFKRSSASPHSNGVAGGATRFATIDENSFIVLVSPSKNKFSQHYIIRFKEDDARFANNSVDAKLVVSCFVEYLYDRAFDDPKVHAALFYHESIEKRNCVVSVNSSEIVNNRNNNNNCGKKSSPLINEEFSFANSLAQIRAQQQRSEKEKKVLLQQQHDSGGCAYGPSAATSSSMMMMGNTNNVDDDNIVSSPLSITTTPISTSNFFVPAVSLRCIIDEAVYSRNRMMRCYGSSKVGKCAILEFDHEWHQGGRLNHFLNGNKEAMLASSLISEPIVTARDERLMAANLFRIIDSESLLESAVARGSKAVQGLQQLSVGGNAPGITRIGGLAQITSCINFTSSDYETTNYNGAASVVKFPVLCREVIAAQASLAKNSNNNNNGSGGQGTAFSLRNSFIGNAEVMNTGNIGIENISFSVPSKDSASNSSGGGSSIHHSNYHHLRLLVKIRGSRYCHVVKRQHRSNGIFWVVKCSIPTTNYIRSVECATPSQSRLHEEINLNGYGSVEQRCFDDDCKNKHTFKVDLSDSALCEIRMMAGLGNDKTTATMSEKMIVLNQGGTGQYLSLAARQLLETSPEYQTKQEEQQQRQKQQQQEEKETVKAVYVRPKMTRWYPPSNNNNNNNNNNNDNNKDPSNP